MIHSNHLNEAPSDIFYFLGNITSHVIHALPLYKELGGTFVVVSKKAARELAPYDIPVIALENKPRVWLKMGFSVRKTFRYLEENAKVVIFYELYEMTKYTKLRRPNTIFLTHGNMLKSYFSMYPKRKEIIKDYSYMTALGPALKKQLIERDGISPSQLVDIGIARTDDIVKNKTKVIIPESFVNASGIDPKKPIVAYLPTFWGASSIYSTGKEILRNIPDTHTLLFRPHPQTPDNLLQDYFKIIATKKNIIYVPEGKFPDLGLVEIMQASSVIIGDVSSVVLEAILTQKPLVFAYDSGDKKQDPSDYALIKDIVEYSEHIDNSNVSELPKILSKATKKGIDKKLWQTTQESVFYNANGGSVKAIARFIRSLL